MSENPQLRMRHPLTEVPQRAAPEGFVVRVANAEDAGGLALVLTESFGELWVEDRVNAELLDDPAVPVTFVAERLGKIVGTASYQEKPDCDAGWLHWVGVAPTARGLRLGDFLSHRVLTEAVLRGRSCVLLTTDDFRLAAIRTYLRLGFEPDAWHESHAERWMAVLDDIAKG